LDGGEYTEIGIAIDWQSDMIGGHMRMHPLAALLSFHMDTKTTYFNQCQQQQVLEGNASSHLLMLLHIHPEDFETTAII
jgi:hypothetical protein